MKYSVSFNNSFSSKVRKRKKAISLRRERELAETSRKAEKLLSFHAAQNIIRLGAVTAALEDIIPILLKYNMPNNSSPAAAVLPKNHAQKRRKDSKHEKREVT